jgi:hypothetical protein
MVFSLVKKVSRADGRREMMYFVRSFRMELKRERLTEVKKCASIPLQYLENKSVMLAISSQPKEARRMVFLVVRS